MIGSVPATVTFSGLTPGFAGLYQVDVLIPQNTSVGSAVPVVMSTGDSFSNTVTMAVQ
jgi:uncharacterized protein (TIGR03437 family)